MTAGSPWFSIGHRLPRGACAMKKAAAIWPLAMNAANGVNRPRAIRAPMTSSMTPASPRRENSSTLSSRPRTPNIFWAPCWKNSTPATMRTVS